MEIGVFAYWGIWLLEILGIEEFGGFADWKYWKFGIGD
jgi:hypothetical protein